MICIKCKEQLIYIIHLFNGLDIKLVVHGPIGGLFETGVKTKPGDTYYYGFQGASPYFNMASTGSWNDNDADESTYVIGTTIMLLVSGGVRLKYRFGRSSNAGGIATFAKLVRNGVEVWKGNLYGGQDVGGVDGCGERSR